MPFHSDIEKWCDLKPNACAVTIGSESFSFQNLIAERDELICRIAGQEMRQKKHPFDANVVAVIAENSSQFVSQFLAATFGQDCCLLLSSALKPVQIRSVLDDIKPDLCFPHSSLEQIDHKLAVVGAARSNDIKFVNDDGATTPFLIGLTSGTTSQPKAFIRNRLSWQKSFARSRSVFDVNETTTTISPGPLAHGLSLYALAETLTAGAHFISMEKFDAAQLVELVKTHEAKRLVLVPTMLSALCKLLETRNIKLNQITSIVSAGAKLDGALLMRARKLIPNVKIFEYYGASELGFITYAERQSSSEHDVGKAFPGVEMTIRDGEGNDLPLGQSGTVWVKSDLVCDGYVSQYDDAGFVHLDGWASVGDIGALDKDGRLTLAGREGDMIISGGNNIYPSSVEAVLLNFDGVENAAVLGLDDAHLGSKLVAIVSGTNIVEAELLAHCRQSLPSYAIPKLIYEAQSWPMTESGKISKKILMDWLANNDDQLRQF
ncbi:MAG: AMP-binding protein [Rhizobiaceae bacterium]|nr:AMP-binding protein [Rhizobiaceae bacterium]